MYNFGFDRNAFLIIPLGDMIFNISTCIFTMYGYITNSQNDQLPEGLKAQLLEHCTGIAEAMDPNCVQA